MTTIIKSEGNVSVKTLETIVDHGKDFAKSEVLGDAVVKAMAILINQVSYATYEQYRKSFVSGYSIEKAVSIETASTAWLRLCARMNKDFGVDIVKPASTAKDATAKADKREETKKAVNDILSKAKDTKSVDKLINDAIAKGDTAKASLALKAKETLIKAVAKEQGATMKARVKAVNDEIKKVKKDLKRFVALEKHLGLGTKTN
jgi:hypothetical protein